MVRRIILRLLCTALVCVIASTSHGRTWTDRTGRTVEAEFIGFAEKKVRIKRASDGKVFDVPLEQLTDADQAFVKSQVTGAPSPIENRAVKDFGGDFQTGLFIRVGDKFHGVPIFKDRTRPSVIKAADDKVSDTLLKDVCKNGDNLTLAPGIARRLNDQANPFNKTEALHIAVFTLDSIPVTKEIKTPAHFEPGPVTKMADVIKKYGKPTEAERWTRKEFKSWIGLNGIVNWWGAVGIAASEDGTITHVFIREKESVNDGK